MAGLLPLDHSHDVVLTHDDEILVIDLDFSPAVFAEQHPVAYLDVRRAGLPVLENLALADRDDLAEGRSLAVSGITIPPGVLRSSGSRLTTTRSCNGRMFTVPPM